MATNADRVGRAIENLCMILVMVTEVSTSPNPTRAQIDAVIDAASTSGVLTPKPTTNVDGESYNWAEYLTAIGAALEQLRKVQALLSGPWEVRSRGVS